jgi:phospholipid/cholesterol/gamma-HCH transport system permease protein
MASLLHLPPRSHERRATLRAVSAEAPAAARAPVRERRSGAAAALFAQLLVSGVRALPLVCVVAFGAGTAIVLQSTIAPTPPSAELGRMLVVVVLRELAPLLTAVLVIGHSVAPLAATLGRAEGAPRPRRAVFLVSLAVATTVLAVYFAALAMLGGYLTSQALTLRTLDAVRAGLQQELALYDLPFFLFKAASLGTLAGAIACALAAPPTASQPEVSLATSRIFAWSLIGCAFLSAALTFALYSAVGVPLPP